MKRERASSASDLAVSSRRGSVQPSGERRTRNPASGTPWFEFPARNSEPAEGFAPRRERGDIPVNAERSCGPEGSRPPAASRGKRPTWPLAEPGSPCPPLFPAAAVADARSARAGRGWCRSPGRSAVKFTESSNASVRPAGGAGSLIGKRFRTVSETEDRLSSRVSQRPTHQESLRSIAL